MRFGDTAHLVDSKTDMQFLFEGLMYFIAFFSHVALFYFMAYLFHNDNCQLSNESRIGNYNCGQVESQELYIAI